MLEIIGAVGCIIIVCIIIVLIESYRECRKFKITKYDLKSNKIQNRIRIVLLADLHNMDYKGNRKKILKDIKNNTPDLIILGGDMIVSHLDQREENRQTAEFIKRLSELAPVFYGIGNHEKRAMLSNQGLHVLWDEYINLIKESSNVYFMSDTTEYIEINNNKVYVLGLDLDVDYYKRFVEKKLTKEDLLKKLGDINREAYNILIAHNPDYFKVYSDYGAELVCSGHNHGGLMKIPFLGGVISPRFRIFPRYDYGVYSNGKTNMILTSGLGAHSIKIRVNNVPEIVVINIDKEK